MSTRLTAQEIEDITVKVPMALSFADMFINCYREVAEAQRKHSDKEWLNFITSLIQKIKDAMWEDDWGVKGVIYDTMLDELVDRALLNLKENNAEAD